jgi:DEAD/DEAH box helicase domain-containing protein
MHDEVVSATRRLIAECPCDNGCPACVGPIGDTGPLAKAAALRILDLLIERAAPAGELAAAEAADAEVRSV